MATIPINDDTPRVQYTASAAQTVFAYGFFINEDADLKVFQTLSGATPDDTADLLTLTTHYTVDGEGTEDGGNVTLVTGAASGDIITIERDIAVKRTTDYQNLGDLASSSFNTDLDNLTMMIQQNETSLLRTPTLQRATQATVPFTMDDPTAAYYARAKADLSGIEWVAILSTTGLTVSPFMETVLDDTTAAAARATLAAAALGANSFTGIQKWAKGADVASATALTVGTDGNYFDVTGTTTITSIVTVGIGAVIKLHFDGVLTLTHHATDLILPSGANITTAAGDEAEFVEYASGDFRCTSYTKADGTALVVSEAGITLGTPVLITAVTSIDFTAVPAGTKKIVINFYNFSTDGASKKIVQIGDAGGIETSGYLGASSILGATAASSNFTTGFGINSNSAADIIHGSITLTLVNSSTFLWAASGDTALSSNTVTLTTAGAKPLSAELDRVRITTVGGAENFTVGLGGYINIQYE